MSSPELDREKITRARNRLVEAYYGASIVERAVEAIDYNDITHSDLDFLALGRWLYIPKSWFTDPSYYPDYFFSQVAEGIVIGEEKQIVEKILANNEVKRTTLDAIDYRNIAEIINDFVRESNRPSSVLQFSMFAPIKYYVAMHTDWVRENSVRIELNRLFINGFTVNLFWSSKYVDYDGFIIFERSLCRWIAKPSMDNRLEVEVRESEKPEKMELKAQTLYHFTILDPERIQVLYSTQPSELRTAAVN